MSCHPTPHIIYQSRRWQYGRLPSLYRYSIVLNHKMLTSSGWRTPDPDVDPFGLLLRLRQKQHVIRNHTYAQMILYCLIRTLQRNNRANSPCDNMRWGTDAEISLDLPDDFSPVLPAVFVLLLYDSKNDRHIISRTISRFGCYGI